MKIWASKEWLQWAEIYKNPWVHGDTQNQKQLTDHIRVQVVILKIGKQKGRKLKSLSCSSNSNLYFSGEQTADEIKFYFVE